MTLEVEILSIDESGNTLDVSVSVSTESTETINYTLNINDTGTGGVVTRSGTLVGGAGSFPGDAIIEDVSFGIGDVTGGTVTAVITAPEEYVGPDYQSQRYWGDAGSGRPGGPVATIDGCQTSRTNDGDLEVTYTLAPTRVERVDAEVTVEVDGQYVNDETHSVPPRGGQFTQTVPAVNLPEGEEMPVSVGVGEDFRDCGTVTVGSGGPGGQSPVSITDCAVNAAGGAITADVTLSPDGDAPTTADVWIYSEGGSLQQPVSVTVPEGGVTTTLGPIDVPAGEYPITIEALVTDANGNVVAVDTRDCGTVGVGQASPGEPTLGLSCGELQEQYGDVLAAVSAGSEVSQEDTREAIELWRNDEITTDELRAVIDAWRLGCSVEASGGFRTAAALAGLGALGVGAVALSRREQ